MKTQRRVQVVLGEAETDGFLRFILEGEGFDIVGLASDDDELARVLRGARPEVVVLDGGISALAALEARELAEGASLVVVWPDGVAAVLAEERVDPSCSISDLGDAVRRAAETTQVTGATIRVPEAQAIDEESRDEIRYADVRDDPASPTPSRGRRGQLLVAATTWMLAITALATIAIAVPNALNPSRRHGGGPVSPGVSVDRPDERTIDLPAKRRCPVDRRPVMVGSRLRPGSTTPEERPPTNRFTRKDAPRIASKGSGATRAREEIVPTIRGARRTDTDHPARRLAAIAADMTDHRRPTAMGRSTGTPGTQGSTGTQARGRRRRPPGTAPGQTPTTPAERRRVTSTIPSGRGLPSWRRMGSWKVSGTSTRPNPASSSGSLRRRKVTSRSKPSPTPRGYPEGSGWSVCASSPPPLASRLVRSSRFPSSAPLANR